MTQPMRWMSRIGAVVIAGLTAGAAIAFAASTKICFDAEAGAFTKPFRLVTAKQATGRDQKHAAQSASGGAFLEILEGANPKDKSKITGEVIYRVNVPATGQYKLWARTDWLDSCGNSFEVIVYLGSSTNIPKDAADRSQFVLGEDSIYRRWHWTEYRQPLSLKKGIVTLRLRNREDGVRVDRIFLCNDLAYVPGDAERVTKGALATTKPTKGK